MFNHIINHKRLFVNKKRTYFLLLANIFSLTFPIFVDIIKYKINSTVRRKNIRIGEVSLNTNNVVLLANFYKRLLGIENNSEDSIHQTLILEETQLTIYNDGSLKNNANQNISLAFTVDDIDAEYKKLLAMGVEIIEKPTPRPWGATNMSFYDPDGNIIYFRSFS